VLPGDIGDSSTLDLDRKTSRYLSRVLRMSQGDGFDAIDEKGKRFRCTLTDFQDGIVRISLAPQAPSMSATMSHGPRLPRLALIQALPKGQKMDLIVRQAAEMGVEAIVPLETRHCVSRETTEADKKAKLERRIKIVREAEQQSGSGVQTKVLPTANPETLVKALGEIGFSPSESLYLICHEMEQTGMPDLHGYLAPDFGGVAILIGPEGGFAPDETTFFMDMGFKPVHFAGTILRTETAAAYALAAVRTILMERNSWNPSK
jgi:16S rRNA (uracil1498-N3)-methyltransferase